MALTRDAERLRRLQMIARLLRDRDLAAVAAALARCQETDLQIESLKAHDLRVREDLAKAGDAQDMMQAQAYCRLLGLQLAGLAAERQVRKVTAEAGLQAARCSFARSSVADALDEAEMLQRRAKSARRSGR